MNDLGEFVVHSWGGVEEEVDETKCKEHEEQGMIDRTHLHVLLKQTIRFKVKIKNASRVKEKKRRQRTNDKFVFKLILFQNY